jgi:hypothetical protein
VPASTKASSAILGASETQFVQREEREVGRCAWLEQG